jgi:glutaredoxin
MILALRCSGEQAALKAQRKYPIMKVELVVTKSCNHCRLLEGELNDLGIPYSMIFIEDNPELQDEHGLRGSPNILVDGKLAFRGMPNVAELKAYFQKDS